ncbi:SCO7613 C-terminal domain-containing membrane protein [Lacisediminihabitans sp. FW035]
MAEANSDTGKGGTGDAVTPREAGEGAVEGIDFRRFAGRALFPRSPSELTDTSVCPACFTALVAPVCRACGLDLSNPSAAEIATLSGRTATLLDQRLVAIGRIRYESSLAAVAPVTTAGTASHPPSATTTLSFPIPLPPLVPRAADATAPPRPPAPPLPLAPEPAASPRRSSVQVILLIVGISLLSVAAIFFLVYAFINFGILGRSLIIAAITIASFVIASGLRRRGLTATAEGIAVLAVVLVYLDAFAVRANDFFGLAAVDGAAFWGSALITSAVGFFLWHRISGLRTPNIVAFSAVVPGMALLVGGLSGAADDGGRAFFPFAAATLAGAVHVLAFRPATADRPAIVGRPERIITLGFTVGALLVAFATAASVAPPVAWAATPAYLVVAALAALHAWLVGSRSKMPRPGIARLFAAVCGVSAGVAVAAGAVRTGDFTIVLIAAPIAASGVALGFEFAWRRSIRAGGLTPSLRREWVGATAGAATIAAVTLVPPLAVSVRSLATVVSRAVSSSWTLDPRDELLPPSAPAWLAVVALAVCVLMFVAARAASGTLARLAAVFAGGGAAVLVLAVPLLDALAAVSAGWLVIAVISLGTLLLLQRRAAAARLRAPLMVTAGVSGALGYLVGWGSTSTWWIGTIVGVALLLASRMLTTRPSVRATALGTSVVVVLLGAAAGVRQLALPSFPDSTSDLGNALRAVSIVAVVLVTLSAIRPLAGISTLDSRVLFWIGAISAAGSVIPLVLIDGSLASGIRMSPLLPEPGTGLAVVAALLAALLVVVARSRARMPLERLVASVALTPALTLTLDQLARVAGLPELVRSVGSISAALIAAVGVLAASTVHARRMAPAASRPSNGDFGDRVAREAGILLVAVPSVIIGVFRQDSVSWLMLVVAALVMLALATSPDGLFGSSSPRRQLGWGALALATAGLWWRLGDAGVVALEPYVLPLSGMVLIVALMVWRAQRGAETSAPDLVAPIITLVALLVAILPLAGISASGPLLRPVVVFGVSAALLVVGSAVVGTARSRPFLDSMALAGALGVLTVVVGRSAILGSQPLPPDIALDTWLAAGLLVLLVAAFGQARDRGDHSETWRLFAGRVLGGLGLIIVLGFEVSAFGDTALGSLRAIAVILLFSAVHVLCFLVDRRPLTPVIGWIAISGAALAVMAGVVTGALHPLELGSVPVAAALGMTGALTLSRVPTSRTWPWLAPATAVLLIPSLVATAGDPAVWRLVALGVVGVAIIVASAVLRLQAPFLIGAVVVLIHAFATFAPQIRAVYESVEWWLWFVPVGIAVVVFAARFEKSVLRMRSVAMRIRALR